MCRNLNAKPLNQIMVELPAARLQIYKPPFIHTGVDYCGAFIVKQGRSKVKRYCCIFTCLTTRAVHIELALDLTADGFLNALRWFISRRRNVKHLYSGNGTNFVGAEKILRNEFLKFD